MKDEEKAEVLNAFFPVFHSQTSWSQDAQPPELEHREQNEAPIVQEEMVSDLLCHLDMWVHGPRRNPLKGTEGTGGGAHLSHFPLFTSSPS